MSFIKQDILTFENQLNPNFIISPEQQYSSLNDYLVAQSLKLQTLEQKVLVNVPLDLAYLESNKANLSNVESLRTETLQIVGSLAPIINPSFQGAVTGITAAAVGLGNVNNTSDADLPISTATQAALDTKVNITTYDAGMATKASVTSVQTLSDLINTKVTPLELQNGLDTKVDISDHNELVAVVDLKANISDVLTSLNDLDVAKADLTYVNDQLNYKMNTSDVQNLLLLEADLEYVNTELATKANSNDVLSALALKSDLTYVDTELALKADLTYVDTELGLKANLSYVDSEFDQIETEVALKSDLTYVDTQLGIKANSSDVTTALNLKSDLTYVDTELDLKANLTYVNTQLTTKANTSDVSTALNLKADVTYVDSGLGTKANTIDMSSALDLKADVTYVDTELALKADITYVDTELNTKANSSDVSSALDLKSDLTYVDTELDLKADLTYVDTELGTKANTIDMSSALDLKADITYVDTELNLKADLAVLESEVGLFSDSLNLKADLSYVDTELGTKVNVSDVNTALGLKASISYVDSGLATKANSSDVTTALGLKASITYVDSGLATKANSSDVSSALDLKADLTYVNSGLGTKANSSDVATSLLAKVDIDDYNDLVTVVDLKANSSEVTSALDLKASLSYVDTQLALKAGASATTTALALKASTSYVDTEIASLVDEINTKQAILSASNRLASSNVSTYINESNGVLSTVLQSLTDINTTQSTSISTLEGDLITERNRIDGHHTRLGTVESTIEDLLQADISHSNRMDGIDDLIDTKQSTFSSSNKLPASLVSTTTSTVDVVLDDLVTAVQTLDTEKQDVINSTTHQLPYDHIDFTGSYWSSLDFPTSIQTKFTSLDNAISTLEGLQQGDVTSFQTINTALTTLDTEKQDVLSSSNKLDGAYVKYNNSLTIIEKIDTLSGGGGGIASISYDGVNLETTISDRTIIGTDLEFPDASIQTTAFTSSKNTDLSNVKTKVTDLSYASGVTTVANELSCNNITGTTISTIQSSLSGKQSTLNGTDNKLPYTYVDFTGSNIPYADYGSSITTKFSSLDTTLSGQSTTNLGFANDISGLNSSKQNVLSADNKLNSAFLACSGLGVMSNTKMEYLSSISSDIQTQIAAKQDTITDASLTIARTNGLQSALDSKSNKAGETYTGTHDFSGATVTGVGTTIADGSLTIAKTANLQTTLDSKLNLSGGTLTGCLFGRDDGVSTNIFTGTNSFATHPIGFVIKWENTGSTSYASSANVSIAGFSNLSNGVWLIIGAITGNVGSTSSNATNWIKTIYTSPVGGTLVSNTSGFFFTSPVTNTSGLIPISCSYPPAVFIATGNGTTGLTAQYSFNTTLSSGGNYKMTFIATKIA